MKCEKCGGEWIPPKDISVSLMNCPFCGAPVLNVDKAKSYQDVGVFLQYLVSLYGAELYENRQKLNNLIADLYQGDERMKRVYRRAIFDDSLSKRIYDLSLRPLNEREVYYNQLVNQFAENNFYTEDFGKQIIGSLALGLQLKIVLSISTKVTEEDGEWIDEYGVKYSSDKKKLIAFNNFCALDTYRIKESTEIICDNAFNYHLLQNVIIPDSVISIGEYAFRGCKFLTNITIPDSIVSIGYGAFLDCESLANIIIPNSVTNIGYGAFCSCENLHITLESYNHFILRDDVLYTADMKKLIWCCPKKTGTVLVPNSVICIGGGAFVGCKYLTNIVIPNSVTSIGWDLGGFRGCQSLKKLTIPNSITSIGNEAFYGCISLESITIPSSVISLGNRVFSLSSLTDITIPNSVTSIGEDAFYLCLLKSITIPDSVIDIGERAFMGLKDLHVLESNKHFILKDDILYTADMKKLMWCCPNKQGTVVIPSSVICIGGGAFADCKY